MIHMARLFCVRNIADSDEMLLSPVFDLVLLCLSMCLFKKELSLSMLGKLSYADFSKPILKGTLSERQTVSILDQSSVGPSLGLNYCKGYQQMTKVAVA